MKCASNAYLCCSCILCVTVKLVIRPCRLVIVGLAYDDDDDDDHIKLDCVGSNTNTYLYIAYVHMLSDAPQQIPLH